MEKVDLAIEKLSLAQKLHLMEALWNDLSKDEEALESPDWHEGVLREREEDLASGRSAVSDWNEAKARIRRNVSCE